MFKVSEGAVTTGTNTGASDALSLIWRKIVRRKPLLRTKDAKRSVTRRTATGLPEVPTFDSVAAQAPPPLRTTDADPSDEAIRRMVEAAYT